MKTIVPLEVNVTNSSLLNPIKTSAVLIAGLVLAALGGVAAIDPNESLGPRLQPPPTPHLHIKHGPKKGLDTLHRWNQIAIDASGFDHGNAREQLGPGRASRATAISHIAIFDAINAATGQRYESYTTIEVPKGAVSVDAAIAQAGRDTLISLYPAQAASFNAFLAEDLGAIKNIKERAQGIILGKRAATACLAGRLNDGSEIPEPRVGVDWITSDLPGHWRQDPISLIPLALGAHWSNCAPFVVESSSQFRCPPFPSMNSMEYTEAYWEVKLRGGDGVTTPTLRTPEQTFIGIFWAYDGTPSLCAPPRLYNQITVQIADQAKLGSIELARLLAIVNVSLSDATLTCWESKYLYDIWRPVTGIRDGLTDGNSDTVPDPTYSPLGAPASNLTGPNFTPPFPAYPSGHASMGGALFQVLRRYFGTDNYPFTFVSDEFNGETKANDGSVRPLIPRQFSSFSQAEEENGQSRIYLGIHWSFDKTEGIKLGHQVGDYVYDNSFRPVRGKGH